MHTIHYSSMLKPNYMSFVAVMCRISLNMHILQSFLKLKIFLIKIPKDSLFIFLVLNTVCITVRHLRKNCYHLIASHCRAE